MQDVLLKHYHSCGETEGDNNRCCARICHLPSSTSLAQFLAFSFATCIGIRHLFLKTKIHNKHVGIHFEIKIQDSKNKGIQKLKRTVCFCNNFALQRPLL